MSNKKIKLQAEIVNGKCPTCDLFTVLVSIDRDFFRCMSCGSDLEQHVNGKITYLPVIASTKGGKPFVREWLDEDG
jgi:ribosomal protein S27E